MRLFVSGLCVLFILGCAVTTAPQDQCRVGQESIRFGVPAGPGGFSLLLHAGGGPPHRVQVDTGSTGIVIGFMNVGSPQVPLSPAEMESLKLVPYILYNSSGKVRKGKWVYTSVEFPHVNGPVTIPKIPVLAVDQLCTTTPGNSDPLKFDCSQSPALPVDCRQAKPGTRAFELCTLGMMGVGLDRGVSMGTSAVNPFLQLPQMVAGQMQSGYVISARQGITLGMTQAEIDGFTFVALQSLGQRNEWAQARGCVSVEGGGTGSGANPVCGDILMDTGVSEMFLSYDNGFLPPFNPPIPPGSPLWNCAPGSDCTINGGSGVTVNVTWPDTGPPLFTYPVTVTPSSRFTFAGTIPAQGWAHSTSLTDEGDVFVNTSRQLLNTADYLYDATCGRIGFRLLTPGN